MKKYINYFFRLIKECFIWRKRIDESINIDFNKKSDFRIITFNLRRDTPDDGSNNWVYRRESAVNMIIDYCPDIICFQECMPTMAKYLIYRLSKYYDNSGVEIFTGREMKKSNFIFGEGLFVMWRKDIFDFNDKKVVKLFDGRKINLRRFIDVILVDKENNEEIHVINTHFCHKSKDAQNKSFVVLKDYVEKLERFYACGDYNTDKAYKNTYITLMMDKYSYNYKKKTTDTTICGYGNKTNTGRIIDYIFSNQPLSDFEIIINGYGCNYLTDHYPVCNYYETKNTNS
jgi:endonuclease/exonuclease/phosphatase family metal-dependent hydrolase